MKINVPFYKSETDTDCGPLALKMAMEFLGKKISKAKASELEMQLDSGLVWTAGIARAAKKLGYDAKIVSISNFSHENDDIEYYKKYASDKGMLTLKKLVEENKNLGVKTEEKDMALGELLSHVARNSIPIVLINWFVLAGKEGYTGHIVPVTGYDKQNIYIHNPGIASPMAYMPVKKKKFQEAWESKGTDKDTVIIYRK